jgi:hypothetical protein
MKKAQDFAMNLQQLARAPFRRLWYLAPLVLLLAGLAALYGPAIHSGLLSDDWGLSVPDPKIWRTFLGHWFGGGKGDFYRPLSRIFIYGEARIFGYRGLAQHWISILLFASTGLLIANRLLRYSGLAAAAICLVFTLFHPTQVETVSWIASQTDLLVGIFFALLCVTLARPLAELKLRHSYLSFAFAVLAYLSKDSAVVIGPLACLFFLAHCAESGLRSAVRSKPLIIATAGQLAIWILYLGWRKFALGAISPVPLKGFRPEHGHLWQYGLNFLSILRKYGVLPMSSEITSSIVNTPTDALWPAILLVAGIVLLIAVRAYLSAMLLAGWIVALIPAITQMHPYFYPENSLAGSLRYFYIPNLFAGAFLGSLFTGKPGALIPGRRQLLPLIVALYFSLHFAGTCYPLIHAYRDAAQTRNHVYEELAKVQQANPKGGTFLVQRLPDSVKDYAFIFRAGFRDFAGLYFPQFQVVEPSQFNFSAITAGHQPVYTIDYSEQGRILVREATEFQSAVVARRISRPEYALDSSKNQKSISQISPNQDLVLTERTNAYFTVQVTGSDPYITIGRPPFEPYFAYQRAYITFELMDEGSNPPGSDTFQFVWSLQDGRTGFCDANVNLTGGRHTVYFDLLNNSSWYREGKLKWARFDLGSLYKGRVKIYALGME